MQKYEIIFFYGQLCFIGTHISPVEVSIYSCTSRKTFLLPYAKLTKFILNRKLIINSRHKIISFPHVNSIMLCNQPRDLMYNLSIKIIITKTTFYISSLKRFSYVVMDVSCLIWFSGWRISLIVQITTDKLTSSLVIIQVRKIIWNISRRYDKKMPIVWLIVWKKYLAINCLKMCISL